LTALKSLLFLLVVPGVVAGYIPLALLRQGRQVETGFLAYLAFLLWGIGILVLLWCFWDFTVKGHGTPAPIDPPKELVVTGLYNYVRNPMYAGALAIIVGHFLWFETVWMIAYAALIFIAFHSFVTFYEEPHLRKTFGPAYEAYMKRVPRWPAAIGVK
jgi:protein-S-isoprenylcysteine O-methyltransferase Ste14